MYHEFRKFLLEDKPQKSKISSDKEQPKNPTKIVKNPSSNSIQSGIKNSLLTIPHEKPEKYLSHLEDAIIDHGHEGVNLVANYLDDAHKLLTGHKSKSEYQVKYDGGTSVIFGIDPQTHQFFIAAKSAPHEKNLKISNNKEDIKKNHGDNSELSQQMTIAFYHLPKILPKDIKPGESYGGDIMHTSKDIKTKGKHIHFKPNSITYSAPSDSAEGATAKKSKIGIVVHTKHNGDGTSEYVDKKTRSKFQKHPDIHNIDPTLEVDPNNYTADNMKEYYKHKDAASKLYKSMNPESFDAAMEHAKDLHKYIHNEHKQGNEPSSEAFIDHLGNSFKDSLKSSKTDKNKKEKTSKHSEKMDSSHNNSQHLDKTLQLHTHLMNAKNVLFHAMAKSIPWIHSLDGIPVSPEGIIAFGSDGSAVKFVDRTAYSKIPEKPTKNKSKKK